MPSNVPGDAIVSFRGRVSSFIQNLNLSDENADLLTREIVRFVLQVDSKSRSRNLRKAAFKMNCLSDIVYFKDQYLNSSSYLNGVLWQAVLLYATKNKRPNNKTVRVDVAFCYDMLCEDDFKIFKKQRSDKRLDVSKIDLTKWSNGRYKTIEGYARSKIHKLGFLSLYDPSMDSEDFVQDILCEFLRIFHSYSRSKGEIVDNEPIEQRVCKYIDKALGNKIKSMIDYYTSASRKRITSTLDRHYKKIKALKKKNGSNPKTEYEVEILKLKEVIKNNNEDYYPTTTELNMNYNTEEGEVKLQIDPSYYNDHYSVDNIIDNVWVNELDETIKDKRTMLYIKALLGRDDDFEKWVDTNASAKDQENIDNNRYGTVCKLAKKYVSLQYEEAARDWKPSEIASQDDVIKCFAIG